MFLPWQAAASALVLGAALIGAPRASRGADPPLWDAADAACAVAGVAMPESGSSFLAFPGSLHRTLGDEAWFGGTGAPDGGALRLGMRGPLRPPADASGLEGNWGAAGAAVVLASERSSLSANRVAALAVGYDLRLPYHLRAASAISGGASGGSGFGTGSAHLLWQPPGVFAYGLLVREVALGGPSSGPPEAVAGTALWLRAQGLRLSLDVAGTNASSLAALRRGLKVRLALAAHPFRGLTIVVGAGDRLGAGVAYTHHPFRFEYSYAVSGLGEAGVHRVAVRYSFARSLEETLSRLYDAADRKDREGDNAAALALWRRLVELDGGYRDAAERIGSVEARARLSDEARESVVTSRIRAGEHTESRGDRVAALEWYELALAADPVSSRAARGRERVLEHFKRLVEPDFTAATAAHEAGRHSEAADAFERVLTVFPRHETAATYLMIARHALRRQLDEVLDRADGLLARDEPKGALAVLRDAERIAPGAPDVATRVSLARAALKREIERRTFAADAFLGERDYARAIEEFQGILLLDVEHEPALTGLSRAREGAQALPDAMKALVTGRLLQQARWLRKAGRTSEAIASVDRSLSIHAADPEAAVLRGEIVGEIVAEAGVLLQRGALAQARLAFTRAIAADPGRDDARRGLAAVDERRERSIELHRVASDAYNAGRADNALGVWREALATDPQNADAREGLTTALVFLGIRAYRAERLEDAIRRWTEALEVSPEHPLARGYIARARRKADVLGVEREADR